MNHFSRKMNDVNVLRTTVVLYCVFYNFVSVSAATECYQCSTTTKPQCADLLETNGLDKCTTTTGDDINCIMYMYSLNGKEIIYRGCRKKSDTCDEVEAALITENKKFLACGVCDTDFCKASSSEALSINIAMIVLFITFSVILT